MATVYREVWTGEVVKGFNERIRDTFLDGVKDYSQYVTGDAEAQVIHSTYFGVRPDVLINNNTYPIPIQELDGKDIPIALDKFQTKATPITDDELFALSYDKIKNVKDAHSESLSENRLMKAIHSFGTLKDTIETPVIVTTGEVTPDGSRKRLTWKDVITLRERYAKAGIPVKGIRFVLCQDHVNDLLLQDTTFEKAYIDFKGGVIINQLGLEIREYSENPYYNVTTKEKLSYGAVPSDATDRQASIAFPIAKVGKASGITKMYYSKAENDPLTQRNLINFRNYFIALPLITEGFGAIVSDKG